MTEEKPLHVCVAEALGWTRIGACALLEEGPGERECWGTGRMASGETKCCPRYDTDWSATGPLIEKYKITVGDDYEVGWVALISKTEPPYGPEIEAYGTTPLLAICELLLKLKGAGKL